MLANDYFTSLAALMQSLCLGSHSWGVLREVLGVALMGFVEEEAASITEIWPREANYKIHVPWTFVILEQNAKTWTEGWIGATFSNSIMVIGLRYWYGINR